MSHIHFLLLAACHLGFTPLGFGIGIVHSLRPCHQLGNVTAASFPIAGISATNTHVFIISADLHVFDVATSSLDSSADQLNLTTAKPMPIATKWPKLSRDMHDALQAAHQIFLLKLWQQEYIFVMGDRSFAFGLRDKKVQELTYQICGSATLPQFCAKVLAWVPSTDNRLFVILSSGKGNLNVARMRMERNQWNTSMPGRLAQLCSHGKDQVQLRWTSLSTRLQVDSSSENGFNCDPVRWPIKRAFLANDKFYLFAADALVYVFSISVYERPVRLQKIAFERFFVCSTHDEPYTGTLEWKTTTVLVPTGSRVVLHVTIIVALLLAAVVFILVVITSVDRRFHPTPPPRPVFKSGEVFNKYSHSRNKAGQQRRRSARIIRLAGKRDNLKMMTLRQSWKKTRTKSGNKKVGSSDSRRSKPKSDRKQLVMAKEKMSVSEAKHRKAMVKSRSTKKQSISRTIRSGRSGKSTKKAALRSKRPSHQASR